MTMTAPGSVQADSTAGGPTPPNPARGLVCRNCGATFGLIAEHACAECFGPLEVDYDPELMRAVTREQIEAGPQNIWRYAALLPVGQDPADRVTLDPGMTPLVRADRLAGSWPTGSRPAYRQMFCGPASICSRVTAFMSSGS